MTEKIFYTDPEDPESVTIKIPANAPDLIIRTKEKRPNGKTITETNINSGGKLPLRIGPNQQVEVIHPDQGGENILFEYPADK